MRSEIIERVLRGISLNRRPGYHFPGNFLDFDVEPADVGTVSVLEQGPYCTDDSGGIDMAFLAVFVDVAMGMTIRMGLGHYDRLATQWLSLSLTGKSRRGPLQARSEFLSLIENAARGQAVARTELSGPAGSVGYALSSFVVLKGTVAVPKEKDKTPPALLNPGDLDAGEREIFDRSERALDSMAANGGSFPALLFDARPLPNANGARSILKNGPHVANRVGHLQGGIQIGMAATTAGAALGPDWILTEINATYLRPGQGDQFEIVSEIVNRGNTTALLTTKVLDQESRVVLYATSNHTLGGS